MEKNGNLSNFVSFTWPYLLLNNIFKSNYLDFEWKLLVRFANFRLKILFLDNLKFGISRNVQNTSNG